MENGDIYQSETGNRYLIVGIDGEYVTVSPLQGIFRGDTHRWHSGSLAKMRRAGRSITIHGCQERFHIVDGV